MLFLTLIEDQAKRSKLEEIYLTYKRDLYITAYSILKRHELAEDMVQTTILKIHPFLDKISEIKCKKTRSYLVIIVRNLCIDYMRRSKKEHLTDSHIEEVITSDLLTSLIEDEIIGREKTTDLNDLVETLHPTYKEIIKLRYYDDLTIDEISQVLGISKNNVSVRIKRGLESLKKISNERGKSFDRAY
ncbi:sigma-70 family RNA polymerase sigma factor [Acidaminobacter sp. JC074]|uniref:RNA polymerase sigma factor n=1 Tax=Acidaminobacter sp. JC074 TaxID=2530199 RepID=UPI001F0DFD96|nr:sigma-70 family RNA polymerase sigma factor [Acidaminobacter sp. JC074]MCH4888616.1 sigma-70 family RNA polymerase sigma factor [Acidaminobacter sp. JC074]